LGGSASKKPKKKKKKVKKPRDATPVPTEPQLTYRQLAKADKLLNSITEQQTREAESRASKQSVQMFI
jgi:hypothetical protein